MNDHRIYCGTTTELGVVRTHLGLTGCSAELATVDATGSHHGRLTCWLEGGRPRHMHPTAPRGGPESCAAVEGATYYLYCTTDADLPPRARIRLWAMDPQQRARATRLVDPSEYCVRREVRTVDGDCYHVARAPVYVVYYDPRPRPGATDPQPVELAGLDGPSEAHGWIAERCSALDDAPWAWSSAPRPDDFHVHG